MSRCCGVSWRTLGSACCGPCLVLATIAASEVRAQESPDPVARLQAESAAASAALRDGQAQIAESRYRAVLQDGWTLIGALDAQDGRPSEAAAGRAAPAPTGTPVPFAALPQAERAAMRRRVVSEVAGAYFNLGVLNARGDRPARAAELLEQAAALDPSFPQLQYSLGVAYFNAQQYAKAAAALRRALAANAADANVRRMLALARLNAGEHAQAAELLRNDPDRDRDPALQYAYGLALVRGDRPREALIVFSQLLAAGGETPELDVMMGQAHAKQGEYDEAVRRLERAIALKPDVGEAHAALGELYLRQGKWPEAAAALRAEIAINPQDVSARHTLATVLDLQGQRDEAITILRAILSGRPEYGAAHYLLGKILLAQGAAAEAVEHLETAVRLDAGNATAHYQLAQAYQRLGKVDLAAREFDVYRGIKDRSAGRTPAP